MLGDVEQETRTTSAGERASGPDVPQPPHRCVVMRQLRVEIRSTFDLGDA